MTLAPLYARRLLDVGPKGLGGMLSAVGLGAVLMALLIAWLGDFEKKGLAILAALPLLPPAAQWASAP